MQDKTSACFSLESQGFSWEVFFFHCQLRRTFVLCNQNNEESKSTSRDRQILVKRVSFERISIFLVFALFTRASFIWMPHLCCLTWAETRLEGRGASATGSCRREEEKETAFQLQSLFFSCRSKTCSWKRYAFPVSHSSLTHFRGKFLCEFPAGCVFCCLLFLKSFGFHSVLLKDFKSTVEFKPPVFLCFVLFLQLSLSLQTSLEPAWQRFWRKQRSFYGAEVCRWEGDSFISLNDPDTTSSGFDTHFVTIQARQTSRGKEILFFIHWTDQTLYIYYFCHRRLHPFHPSSSTQDCFVIAVYWGNSVPVFFPCMSSTSVLHRHRHLNH